VLAIAVFWVVPSPKVMRTRRGRTNPEVPALSKHRGDHVVCEDGSPVAVALVGSKDDGALPVAFRD
jgi:hypothetical protein